RRNHGTPVVRGQRACGRFQIPPADVPGDQAAFPARPAIFQVRAGSRTLAAGCQLPATAPRLLRREAVRALNQGPDSVWYLFCSCEINSPASKPLTTMRAM